MKFSQLQPKIPEHALFRELGGEAVLLNLKTEQYFGLDEVGTRMWVLLSQSPTVQVVFETLLEEYDVEAPQLTQDLEELLERLIKGGLLELQASS